MMRANHKLVIYFLALLLPTLLVAAVLAHLLRHESSRLEQIRRSAAIEEARSVSDQLIVVMEGVERDIMVRLRGLPQDNLVESLHYWERHDPLIRNVFVVNAAGEVIVPAAGESATVEERSFLRRFEPLFNGEASWETTAVSDPVPSVSSESAPRAPLMSAVLRGRFSSERSETASAVSPVVNSGWLPWFAGRELHFLGWACNNDGLRYGVELEIAGVLASLVVAFPNGFEQGRTILLRDGNGNIVHGAGGDLLNKEQSHLLADISLAPTLPHWRIVVMEAPGAVVGGRMVTLVAVVLCMILVVAIMVSGWLLLRDAYRHQREAQTKTTFVANVSHELRTPLTSIRMYAELLHEGRVASDEKRQHYLTVIVQEAQRLTRLVGNVLDFSRIEQGRKTYHGEVVDLATVIEHVVGLQKERITAAGIKVVIDVADDLTVWCDCDSFEQVLLNLIDNAIKYGASGGQLSISAISMGDKAVLRLCDNGPGVPLRLRKNLFLPFHRADDSITATQPGCGLGLSISRRLLRDMGGELDYEPNPDGGACFVLTVPILGESDETA